MNRKFIISFCLIFLFFFFSPCFKFAFAEDYDTQQFIPEIEELSSLNFLFAQYQQDVQNANKNYYREKENELIFYRYKAKNDETLISIASRCSIRQDTLATINSISESKEIVAETQPKSVKSPSDKAETASKADSEKLVQSKENTEPVSKKEKQ